MAATLQWSESNGVGESVTDGLSNLNFGSIDSANIVAASYPIVAGENSYEKYIRLKFTGSFTEISNIKVWKSAGAYVTDEIIKAAANQTYSTPIDTTSSKATSDIPITEGTALSLQSYEGASTIENVSGVSGYTKYLVIQLQTSGSTPAGAVNQKTITLQYDEV